MKNLKLILTFCLAIVSTTGFAAQAEKPVAPLTQPQLQAIIDKSGFEESFDIQATPAVLKKINYLRQNPGARMSMKQTLYRISQDLPRLKASLHRQGLPDTLLAIPIIESDYRLLEGRRSHRAAGVWQFLPATARQYGLAVKGGFDQRMDVNLSTKAASNFLSDLYASLHNWKLVVAGYTLGGGGAHRLMRILPNLATATLLNSPLVPRAVKTYISRFDVAAIILKNPHILDTNF